MDFLAHQEGFDLFEIFEENDIYTGDGVFNEAPEKESDGDVYHIYDIRKISTAILKKSSKNGPIPNRKYKKYKKCFEFKLSSDLESDLTDLSWLRQFNSTNRSSNVSSTSKEESADLTDLSCLTNNKTNVKSYDKQHCTYNELIKLALEERGPSTTSEIYQWMLKNRPTLKANDAKWKNCVRHNLTVNPCFIKGAKSPRGPGHLWMLTEYKPNVVENSSYDNEVTAAVSSIL